VTQSPLDSPSQPPTQAELDVLKHQAQTLHEMAGRVERLDEATNLSIQQTEALLGEFDIHPSPPGRSDLLVYRGVPDLRSWAELVADAERNIDSPGVFADILTADEIRRVEDKLAFLRGDFDAIHRLDKLDWAICGVAGLLAALVDIFMVQMPQHPGFLGGEPSAGGPLANWIRDKVNRAYSPAQIKQLEAEFWTPYDPATSINLVRPVAGLGPSTHRFQSLGHDPILGFLFGVKDILQGTFTAIDKTGKLIVQPVPLADPALLTMNLFDAIGRVFGHLQSDVATAAGLPAPLMPLFQFLQFGAFGQHGYTVGEISRIMYRSHYDFRYFLAMSVAPLLIEVVVRLCYFAKRLSEGRSIADATPFALSPAERKPKLHTMLFSAHLASTAANAGKVALMQNPLSINYAQWLAFFGYALPQAKWVICDKEDAQMHFVQDALDSDWAEIDRELAVTWQHVFREPIPLL